MLLEMPVFQPHYKKWKKYGYTNLVEKNNLKDALEESTGGYCMYCYTRVRVDEKLYANLEHAIEKSNSDKLMEFEPAKKSHTYSDRELRFIEAHIKRFRLNDPQFRSRQLFDFVKNVIDNNGNIPKYEYNNLTVKLFRENLADKSSEEILKICKNIFIITFAKM